ncbi:ABC transporter ATP-binding protein [Sediminimonas qiaohouensis]|uniref:ABC transporter ATP-binding protein n=1 Tax=Sediminimonas qiaohouensis TaxID=552061 RepID=UPI00041D12F5|nr:ABC transporter ATP-binding protein [Sediminimonas qiaohouensis]
MIFARILDQLVAWSGLYGKRSLLWRLLSESIPEHRGTYLAAIVAMIVVAITTALSAWVMEAIIDAMSNTENRAMVFLVAAAVAGIFILKGLATFAQIVLMARAGNRIVAQKQIQMFQRLLGQSMAFYNTTESSNVLLRITQSAQMVRQVIDTIVTGFVRDVLTLAGLVVVMFYQQPVLSLVCLIVGPAALYGVRLILVRVRTIMSQEMMSMAEIIRVVQETAAGTRVIKTFALEDFMDDRMNSAVRNVEKRANKMIRLEAATKPLMDTITGLAIAAIVVLSTISLFGEAAGTPGQLMSFVTAFLMAYEPAKRLSKMRVSIERGMVGVRMMYDLLDTPRTMVEAPDAQDLPDGPGHLRLEDVHFSYGKDKMAINGVTLDCPAGKTTALVGPSGGGKSTLMNLILRLYDPDSGEIRIDGVDLKQATFASLRRNIAYVGQDTFLFSASIMENLRIARSDATDDEVIDAARVAHADEFIQQLSDGYHTPIGENGSFLSGGQRQRLAIARAVLRRAPILLLDEATSALDSHSEVLVRDALERVTKDVTTIVVAHRLSTVLQADQICYIQDGRAEEVGTLSELLQRKGKFRTLYDQQFAGTQLPEDDPLAAP